MSLNNTLANVLSFIQNYEQLGKSEVLTKNNSKLIRGILTIMKEEGYIGGFEEVPFSSGNMLKIMLTGNINKTNIIRPNYQIKLFEYEKFEKRYLPAKNFGIIIISTNKGLMTHNQAKENKLGGKLLAYCY
ncbi:MAG: 30S ribosomal protein S8 [Nanoarchaeota archaeon]|nr:30S ribosomal protein S8 [Nanoarchaeota archaeon]MBU1269142.1 30S ribosomal protein S8 [Nanoarchaeota archaeon]MBU1605104.1 30S ribosomal protein S8 [Nanoarchaeota archaeon]MBU2442785.1 30S ribosomal protein S8 [Nanoarchaeota archaeon]